MRYTVSTLAAAAAMTLGAATMAIAQPSGYRGPTNASGASARGTYAGPSAVPLMTVKDLLDKGRDDQDARLQGRIVSHDGDDRYTFEDATGRITAEIDDDDIDLDGLGHGILLKGLAAGDGAGKKGVRS